MRSVFSDLVFVSHYLICSNVKVIYPDLPRQSLFGRHMLASSPDSYSYSDTEDNSTPPYSRETFIIGEYF